MTVQQTMTCDFTCSVSEFTSSTGLIHVNSHGSVNKFGVLTHDYHDIFFHTITRTCETVPVLTRNYTCQTRSKQTEHVMNQYDTYANWFRNGSLFAG